MSDIDLFYLFFLLQNGNAISLDATKSQWVDLGVLEGACLAQQGSCGDAGGALAFCMILPHQADGWRGVISSRKDWQENTNFAIYD